MRGDCVIDLGAFASVHARASALTPGLLVAGRYRLERKLAEGGMGTVWVARHTTLDCRLALKFLALDGADADAASGSARRAAESLAQFEQEAKAAAMLGSETDYVVRIFDFGVDEGLPFIAMELLEGEDLGARLAAAGPLAPSELMPIAAQIASALKKAHLKGVVHRDLKPENVFLVRRDDEERVKILDFGLAKVLGPGGAAQRAQPMGTLHYMAPELLTSHSVDRRGDLWSFGVVLYRALTGVLPFDATSLSELVLDICNRPIMPPSCVIPALGGRIDDFFLRALRRDPDERFQHGEEMVRAFADAARVSWRPPPSYPSLPPTAPMTPVAPPSSKRGASPIAYEPWNDDTLLPATSPLGASF
jgi:serine/threonine-protein kinase